MLLKVVVTDDAGAPSPCRVKVLRPDGAPAMEAYCSGEKLFALPQGEYVVEARRGKLYRPASCRVKPAEGGRGALAELRLERIVDAPAMGLYCFDAHSHVSRDDESVEGTLAAAALIMRCEGFNFFFAGSPYDAQTHHQYLIGRPEGGGQSYREKYARLIGEARAPDFILDIGNEVVKGRYGHAFMLNYDQMPPFSAHYDEAFDRWLFCREGPEPPYTIAYPYEALNAERSCNSVAVAAHPTSWWRQDGHFIPNIAASIGFDALAGAIDAVVVMGYGADRPEYRALWFELLNSGCFLPGVAETDAAFDRLPGDFLQYRTYAWLDEFSVDALCRAVRAGRCFVSSGPLVELRVGGRLPGSVFTFAPGQQFDVDISCIACCDGPLKGVQLIQDGEMVAQWEANGSRWQIRHHLRVEHDGFIVIKCIDGAGNAAMTSPVYFRNSSFVNDGYRAHVRVCATAGGAPASGHFWLDGGERRAFEGSFELAMPPASALHVQAGGREKRIRLFELEELQTIFQNLYLGRFAENGSWQSGEVPVPEYRIGRIREILDDVRLNLDFND